MFKNNLRMFEIEIRKIFKNIQIRSKVRPVIAEVNFARNCALWLDTLSAFTYVCRPLHNVPSDFIH